MKDTALAIWMWDHRVSNRDLADMMAKELKVERFSPRTVEKWRYGKRVPVAKNALALRNITGIELEKLMKAEAA